jgi:hypothetical protein
MMKKITLLFAALFIGVSMISAQTVLLSEDFEGGTTLPTGWTTFDQSGNTPDPTVISFFPTAAWTITAETADNQVAAATSWFSPAGQANAWLVSPQVSVTGANFNLKWKALSFDGDFPEAYQVLVSTTGTAVGDFSVVYSNAAESDSWTTRFVSLSAYDGEDIYVAFRIVSNDAFILAIDDVEISEAPDYLQTITNVTSTAGVKHLTTGGLFGGLYPANFPVFVVDHSKRESFDINVTIQNDGLLDSDSAYIAYYLVDIVTNQFIEVIDSVEFATPLASGASYTHTFTSNITVDIPGYGNNSALILGVLILESNYNVEEVEETFIAVSPVAPFEVPYSSSFEVAAGGNLDFNNANFSWKSLDFNADGVTWVFRGFSDVPAHDGSILALSYAAVNNDALQSPELRLENGKTYQMSIYARTGFGQTGTVSARVTNSAGANLATLGNVALVVSDTLVYKKFSFNYAPSATADDYMFQFVKGASSGLVILDLFEVVELVAPTVSLTLVNSSLTPGNGVEYCDSTVTVNYVVSGPPASLTINWGNGQTTVINNPNPSGSATYSYSGLGTFSITASATNSVGTGNTATPISVEIAALPDANANFVVTSTNPNTGVVTFQNNSTPNCPGVTYIWDFGDGNSGQGNQTTHTYTANGPFTITLTMNTGVGGAGAISQFSVQVGPFNVTSINEIDFTRAVSVYPNPSRDMVNVAFELSKMQNVELSIVSIDGKVVATQNMSNALNVNTSFNVSKLNSGVYLMKVKTDDGLATQRFVVSHN